MGRITTNLAILLCMLGIIIASCKRSTPAPAPAKTVDTLVIVVGGWGSDQTTDIAADIRAKCSRAVVVSAGSWDAYRTDIRPIVLTYPLKHRVLILHSFGSWWCAVPLPPVDYVVLIDPVSPGGFAGISFWGDLPYPAYAARVDGFYRSEKFGPKTADIPGVVPIIIPGSHNTICHSPALRATVVSNVNAL